MKKDKSEKLNFAFYWTCIKTLQRSQFQQYTVSLKQNFKRNLSQTKAARATVTCAANIHLTCTRVNTIYRPYVSKKWWRSGAHVATQCKKMRAAKRRLVCLRQLQKIQHEAAHLRLGLGDVQQPLLGTSILALCSFLKQFALLLTPTPSRC